MWRQSRDFRIGWSGVWGRGHDRRGRGQKGRVKRGTERRSSCTPEAVSK